MADKNTQRKVQRSVAALCAGIESHAARRAVHVLHELSADQAAAACIKRAGGQVRLERLLKASEVNVRGEGGDPLSTLNTVRLRDACMAVLSRLSGVGSERRPAVKSSAYGRPPPNARQRDRAAQKPRGATLGDYLEVAVQRSSSASSGSSGKAKRDTGQDARPQPLAVIEATAAERPGSPASRRASRRASLGSQISPSAEAAAARAEQYTSRVRRARAENMSRLREGIKRSSVGVAVAPC